MEAIRGICYSAAQGDLAAVSVYVEEDPDLVHGTDEHGLSAMIHALLTNRVEVVLYLLDHGADIHYRLRPIVNDTPLHLTCVRGYTAMAAALMKRGADVKARNEYGWQPLLYAAVKGHGDIVELLAAHDSSLADLRPEEQAVALRHAYGRNDSAMLMRLLRAGGNPTVSHEGSRVMLYAARDQEGRAECVSVLKEWERPYIITRARSVHDASMTIADCAVCARTRRQAKRRRLEAAPAYLRNRVKAEKGTLRLPGVAVEKGLDIETGSGGFVRGEKKRACSTIVVNPEIGSIGDQQVRGMVVSDVMQALKGELFLELLAVLDVT